MKTFGMKSAIATAVAGLVALTGAAGPASSHGYSRADVRAMTIAAADRHGVSRWFLVNLVHCESNFFAGAVGRLGERGPMQLHPEGIVYASSHGALALWDTWTNIDAGAELIAAGYESHWSCAPYARRGYWPWLDPRDPLSWR